jgi:polysaccharide export outer membrane protein/exopolysaccharide production protein ExoF
MMRRLIQLGLVALTVFLVATRVVGVSAEEGGAAPADALADYRLGPQDKISIKVYEWRPSRDEIYEWVAFNKAEYTVNASGSLSLPLLGSVAVSGISAAELATTLGERLKDRMGLIDPPDVTVEVVEYRPFYIVGAVDKPGGYPYRPGLTVMEAYALAGGKQRSALGAARLEREAIATRGELKAYGLEIQSLLARMARLQAELGNTAQIAWPAELKEHMSVAEVDSAVRQEQLVFDTRRDSFQTQVSALEQLQAFLEKEVASLEKQLQVHEVEVNSVKGEFEIVEKLYKKGLTAAPRKLAMERNVAQVDGERLRLESSLMRARQEISKTKIAIIDLQGKRSSEISSEMQKAQARLDELKSRTQTSKNLLFETEVLAPQMIAKENTQALQPVFKIVHRGQPLSSEQVVTQETVVEPGDTITVEQPLRESSIAVPLPTFSSQDTPTASVDISNERLR